MLVQYSKPLPIQEVKAAGDGSFEVSGYVSTFGNLDRTGDVIMAGAFDKALADGRKIKFLFAHDQSQVLGVPLALKADEHGLFGKFKISRTRLGEDVHTLLKDGALDSFSIGFFIDELDFDPETGTRILKAIDLLEASVVAVPANPEAVVTNVKTAIAGHKTATSDAAWDGPANEARLPTGPDADRTAYRKAYAWYDTGAADPNGDGFPDAKAAYRFLHHLVAADGTVGAASTVACSAGIGVLNGARGGSTIPAADRAGVYAHLARHLRDAGKLPPPLKAVDPAELTQLGAGGLTMDQHRDLVLVTLTSFVDRCSSLASVRAADNRTPGAAFFERLQTVRAAADDLLALQAVKAADPAPAPASAPDDAPPPPSESRPRELSTRLALRAARLRHAGILEPAS